MDIGYARVSTSDQSVSMQEDALNESGCSKIFTDFSSGVKADRPGLEEALAYAREGDTLVVWRLDRLGRSVKHLIETIQTLADRKIGFKCLQEKIDTTTSTGKLIFHVFSALAEFEKDLIQERTQAGLKAARSRGRFGGRPASLTENKVTKMMKHYNDRKLTVADICKLYGISRPSFYNYLKKRRALGSEDQLNLLGSFE